MLVLINHNKKKKKKPSLILNLIKITTKTLQSQNFKLDWWNPLNWTWLLQATRTKSQSKSYLFGASRGLICRVEVDHNRLAFVLGKGHIFPILVFQSKRWWHITFWHLQTFTKSLFLAIRYCCQISNHELSVVKNKVCAVCWERTSLGKVSLIGLKHQIVFVL